MKDNDFEELEDFLEDKFMRKILDRYEKMASKNHPDFLEIDEYLAIVRHFSLLDDEEKVKKAISMGLRQHPDSIELKLENASYLIDIEKQEEALNLLQQIDSACVFEVENLIIFAQLYEQLEQFDLAIEKYKKVIAMQDQESEYFLDAYMGLSFTYEKKNMFSKAIAVLQEAFALKPDNQSLAHHIFYLFMEIYKKGAFKKIIHYFEKITAKHPFSACAWFFLGFAFYEEKRYQEAIEALEYSLALEEKGEVMICLMHTCFIAGEYNKGLETFHAFVKQEPNNEELAWIELGECYYKVGEFSAALNAFCEAINKNPDLTEAYIRRGMVYAECEEFELAVADIKSALAKKKSDFHLWLLLGEYMMETDNKDETLAIYTYIAEKFPKESDTWLAYSDFYVMEEQYSHAIKILQEGIDHQPDNIEYLYRMANYLFLKGDSTQAITYLCLGYASDPDLFDCFFNYDEEMYENPEVIHFLQEIENNKF